MNNRAQFCNGSQATVEGTSVKYQLLFLPHENQWRFVFTPKNGKMAEIHVENENKSPLVQACSCLVNDILVIILNHYELQPLPIRPIIRVTVQQIYLLIHIM